MTRLSLYALILAILALAAWVLFSRNLQSQSQPTLSQITREARYEFESKAMNYADSYNDVMRDYQDNKADIRKYRKAAKLWDKMYADPGWLK